MSPLLRHLVLLTFLLSMGWSSCKKGDPGLSNSGNENKPTRQTNTVFTLLTPRESGVDFVNTMKEDYVYNNFNFEYMYNGGGVAIGDVNGDKLPDLYFSSSRFSNKLYLNTGNMKFVDVTDASGVGAQHGFKTGVAMADVNGDGWLDIYSCRTSKLDDGTKNNHLFIHTGIKEMNGLRIPVYVDMAKEMGLTDNANSNHSCFFDYDLDGDLDLYLVNHKLGFIEANKLRLQPMPDGSRKRVTTPETPFESNRMYRNDNGRFVDVTEKAGMVSSTFALSATAADLNGDGWPDLYVANDYVEPDFVYINNRNGTFTDKFTSYMKHTSHSSMGADIADMNNDGLVDIMVLEMKAEDPVRYKQLMNIMAYDRYQLLVDYGYGRQTGRNILHLNNGNGTFSDVGQYAGVAATDWSWGVLMIDVDNDGWKDMYISNGYRKDVTQLDYLNYFRDSLSRSGGISKQEYPDINEFLKYLPEQKIRNYLYLNNRDLTYQDATDAAGMTQLSFSNGCAYADLDQDGDLDIVVNNIDDPAFIYRNDSPKQNWLQVQLTGNKGNTFAIGTAVDVYAGGNQQRELMHATRGFFSTSEPILHFGLGASSVIDSIIVTWPGGEKEILRNLQANQRMVWKHGTGEIYKVNLKAKARWFDKPVPLPGWQHQENDFVDFKRERLLPYMLSAEGPCVVPGDINGDQRLDLFLGNGQGFASQLFVQQPDGTFTRMQNPAIDNETGHENCGAAMLDVDTDGDNDMVVISGGNAYAPNDPGYMTRLFLNDGKGQFNKDLSFPIIRTNAGAVLAFDYDQDGDQDIAVAGRGTPGRFPEPAKSYLLRNEKGKFVDVTQDVFPALDQLGMLTDIQSGDLNRDGKIEIVITGEWMPVRVFSFDGSAFKDMTSTLGFDQTEGWWKSVVIDDVDGDGDQDLICGNQGLNHRLHATPQYPVTLVTNDFDQNGSLDPILCFYHQAKLKPFAGRDAIIGQIPMLKKKFARYLPYSTANLEDIFSKAQLEESTQHVVRTFATTYFRNEQNRFVASPLPYQIQLHPTYDILCEDINGDGKKDIIAAGNFTYAETETGEMDAGCGTVLLQQQDGTFAFVPNREHGFWAQGEVRDLVWMDLPNDQHAIITGNNRGPVEMSTWKSQKPLQ